MAIFCYLIYCFFSKEWSYHFLCRGQRWGRLHSAWDLYPGGSWGGSGGSSLWCLPPAFVIHLSAEEGSDATEITINTGFYIWKNMWHHQNLLRKRGLRVFWCSGVFLCEPCSSLSADWGLVSASLSAYHPETQTTKDWKIYFQLKHVL